MTFAIFVAPGDAAASPSPNGTYTISATIAHADTGWKHYADKFEILAPTAGFWERGSFAIPP